VSFDIDPVLLQPICRSRRLYAPHKSGYRARLAADGVELLTPAKQRIADNESSERRLGSTQLVIESAFSNLNGQMRLDHTRTT
jgi:hypothetical protein